MLSKARFLDVMAATPAPVTVVTTTSPPGPVGSTVSAFMSVSLDPMLVVVALDRRSRVLPRIESNRTFGVNVLAAGQTDTALVFARSGADKFADADWEMDDGLPRLKGTACWLACDLESAVVAGDHTLLIGAVGNAACAPLAPLVYSHRLFGVHSKASQRFRTPMEAHVAAMVRTGPPPPLKATVTRTLTSREYRDA
ncbi:flavin reductase family protein [Streptomyces longwoodensis]|uniref:flavin reductase family protein n=1 Tax=Streptomyces longwoodensis TaxID=68231 RepID=UPI0034083E91